MGIIIAVAVVAAAVFFKLRYRPEGRLAVALFGICLASATAMALTVGTFSRVGILFYVAEAVICALIVLSYRYEARRQFAIRAAKRHAAAVRAAQERLVEQNQRRSLSSFAAFTESVGEAA